MKNITDPLANAIDQANRNRLTDPSRELSIAMTHMDTAMLWFKELQRQKELNDIEVVNELPDNFESINESK